MTLDDERIERYSRQLILAEVGPRGQERLLAARVAVVGAGVAAERIVAYLAAAGVGWIGCDAALQVAVDPEARDVTLGTRAEAERDGVGAAVVVADSIAAAADAVGAWRTAADATLWIAAGRAGGAPPCPRCAAAAVAVPEAPPPELAAIRDVVLATLIATETVKTLLAIGVSLAGRLVAYDPTTATLEVVLFGADCSH